jgi:hypothetical protein
VEEGVRHGNKYNDYDCACLSSNYCGDSLLLEIAFKLINFKLVDICETIKRGKGI